MEENKLDLEIDLLEKSYFSYYEIFYTSLEETKINKEFKEKISKIENNILSNLKEINLEQIKKVIKIFYFDYSKNHKFESECLLIDKNFLNNIHMKREFFNNFFEILFTTYKNNEEIIFGLFNDDNIIQICNKKIKELIENKTLLDIYISFLKNYKKTETYKNFLKNYHKNYFNTINLDTLINNSKEFFIYFLDDCSDYEIFIKLFPFYEFNDFNYYPNKKFYLNKKIINFLINNFGYSMINNIIKLLIQNCDEELLEILKNNNIDIIKEFNYFLKNRELNYSLLSNKQKLFFDKIGIIFPSNEIYSYIEKQELEKQFFIPSFTLSINNYTDLLSLNGQTYRNRYGYHVEFEKLEKFSNKTKQLIKSSMYLFFDLIFCGIYQKQSLLYDFSRDIYCDGRIWRIVSDFIMTDDAKTFDKNYLRSLDDKIKNDFPLNNLLKFFPINEKDQRNVDVSHYYEFFNNNERTKKFKNYNYNYNSCFDSDYDYEYEEPENFN